VHEQTLRAPVATGRQRDDRPRYAAVWSNAPDDTFLKECRTFEMISKDLETRGATTGHDDLRLWLRILTLHKLINNEVRKRLRETFGMSLSRFDLLAQLDGVQAGMRMGELSERLMVTTGNITGLTDELEADGLVERTADPSNRRASVVRMTPKGRKAFRAAAKANEQWIAEFFSAIAPEDKASMYELLGKQKDFVVRSLQRPVTKGTARSKQAT
jgi:DNA-binding MarR family transcriptional regulator